MIYGLETWQLALGGMGALAMASTATAGYLLYDRRRADGADPLAESDETVPDGGHITALEAPNLRTSRLGVVGELWRMWRHRKKRRKLANKGYVQWYLVGDTWPAPKYVQPEGKGGGIWEYEHDGETYLFPKSAMLPDENQGLRTVVHYKGDATPANLDTPEFASIPPDALKEYLEMRVSQSPPSWLDQFDLEPADLFKYALFAFMGFVLLKGVFGGGMPI